MFNKKTCNNCSEKLKSSYNFCPECGSKTNLESTKWGMLGKNDESKAEPQIPKAMGGLTGGLINKMLGNTMKMLEKELQKEMGQNQTPPNTKFKLMINGKELSPQVNLSQQGNSKENVKILPIEFSKDNLKKWSKLEKESPKTNLKRVGDEVRYEIDIDGVNSIKDISIMKLENGIEVKAISKDKAYLKTISIDLPLKKYSLFEGKLTLNLDAGM